MKRPSFQFYPADWLGNLKLRRCSDAARGIWADVLCLLHNSDEYGLCRWPLEDLARAAGASIKLVRELVQKEVLKGADQNFAGYVHTPRHAGKDGEPVTLIEPSNDPVWFSSRMVRDEWLRNTRGGATRFQVSKASPNTSPNRPPTHAVGDELGDGSSTPSPSSDTSLRSVSTPKGKSPKRQRKPPSEAEPPGFREWYEAFPRKEKPGYARKCYARALEKADAQTLLAGARRYAEQRRREDPQFTQYPSSWLNDECWLNGQSLMSNGDGQAVLSLAQAVATDPWDAKVKRFKERGIWVSPDGYPPDDQYGRCGAPKPILEKYGYRAAKAAASNGAQA